MVANSSTPARKIEINSQTGSVKRCSILVAPEVITQYDLETAPLDVYELKATVCLTLHGFPGEFRFSCFIPNDLDYAASLAQFWASVKACAVGRGCMETDPIAGLYLLQDFFGLIDLSSGLYADFSLVTVAGQVYNMSLLSRLSRHVTDVIRSLEAGNYNPEDVVFWLLDTVMFPTEISWRFDPFAWMG